MITIQKNRDRSEYSFANINLLGQCNAKCFFCLGEDIPHLLRQHNQNRVHFSQWKNFDRFLETVPSKRLYITGQNTDSLVYHYIDELIPYLKGKGFDVGIRTNGYLAEKKIDTVNQCTLSVGYSIHSLKNDSNKLILGRNRSPNWDYLLTNTNQSRVSIVLNRYNKDELYDLLDYISQFPNVKYIQIRRISTDHRFEQFKEDIQIYEDTFKEFDSNHTKTGEFYLAQQYDYKGKEVNFWRTVETSVNSWNYFTDGTISDNYFVVEGYEQNYQRKDAQYA